jgi:hypothetical protein
VGQHADERVARLVSLPCRRHVADDEDRAARALSGTLSDRPRGVVLDGVGGDLQPPASFAGETRLDRTGVQLGSKLCPTLEPREDRIDVDLLDRPEHAAGGAVRERDDAVAVDHHDAFADRPDDRVQLGGPRPLRADELGQTGFVGKALAERGGESDPLPVALVLGLLAAGDVMKRIDRELDAPGAVAERHGADRRPAFLAGGADAETDGQIARRFAPQDASARQALRVQRPALLVDELEPAKDCLAAGGEELLRRSEAAGARGRVVRVDDPPVRRLDGEAVRDDVDDLPETGRVEVPERGAAGQPRGPGRRLGRGLGRRLSHRSSCSGRFRSAFLGG